MKFPITLFSPDPTTAPLRKQYSLGKTYGTVTQTDAHATCRPQLAVQADEEVIQQPKEASLVEVEAGGPGAGAAAARGRFVRHMEERQRGVRDARARADAAWMSRDDKTMRRLYGIRVAGGGSPANKSQKRART
eukprot:TRINITY_DN1178_c0_g1_i4.p3 TRINITY_DN1178_c0_g1~~TRINITY_DN1178_c0_g1_i4.p3  ORF type:complete len:134 (-),score=24.01 TRINITY_DN1178_c0_g1_i4:116-517(-)